MESRILLLGPVGAGKTTAVRTISDTATVDTDVRASDDVRKLKATTTVAMDMGIMQLGPNDRVVLYGAPGQDRFDFMWDILLQQSDGALLVLDHAAENPVADLHRYHEAMLQLGRGRKPMVVGVTHVDQRPDRGLDIYEQVLAPVRQRCGCFNCSPTVQPMDARSRHDVRAVLAALAAILDVNQRFAPRTCQA
jgi:signal recognition particle receptor subunit beta